jgi:ferric-dicitrate binding protein FerR (iron transport regulator)
VAIEFNDIDDLIGKVLCNEATPVEIREVEEWRKVSPENEKYYLDMQVIFSKAAGNRIKIDFDTDAAWRKVKDKLSKQTGGKVVVMTDAGRTNWTALRIAAGIVLIITAGIFTWRWFNQSPQTLALVTDTKVVQDTLPDGSTAFLNKRSSIRYEYDVRKKTRKVTLKGEGFFDVVHEEEKPFVIETDEALIRDLGTSFNIKSYPESDTIEVVVQTGVVQFYTLKNPGMTINAGETGYYSKREKSFSKIVKADTNVLSYKTRVFSFHNTDLKSVIDQINEVYDSRIVLASNELADCRVNTVFRNEELDYIVDVLASTFSFTIEKNDKNEIILSGQGCNNK